MGRFIGRFAFWVAVGVAISISAPGLFGAQEISHEAAKLNQRGVEQLHKKEYDQAIASFREALQIQPEYPEALDNLGKALEATGKDAEAIADFDKAIQDCAGKCGRLRGQGAGAIPRREIRGGRGRLPASARAPQGLFRSAKRTGRVAAASGQE